MTESGPPAQRSVLRAGTIRYKQVVAGYSVSSDDRTEFPRLRVTAPANLPLTLTLQDGKYLLPRLTRDVLTPYIATPYEKALHRPPTLPRRPEP